MRLSVIALISLLIVSNTCAGWLTFGGKIHSDTTDTVTGVQSQQLVNVESGLTVVSSYTNDLAAAAAHSATEHSVTGNGGFQAGDGASADQGGAVGASAYTTGGGAVGSGASATDGGAVGSGASADLGGAVGSGAQTTYGGAVGSGAQTTYGGAVGSGAYTTDGGAVGLNARTSDGFAGGKDAFATTDGTGIGDGIDAIQLGTGGNTEPFTLQIYGNRLLNADGTIPVERLTLHDTNVFAHEGVYLLRTYTNAVPVAGNTLLTLDGTNLTVTGATFAYRAFPTNAYRLGISPTAPAFHYGGTIIGTNAVTFATNLLLRGTATVSGTNCFALQPWTNGTWEVMWGGK